LKILGYLLAKISVQRSMGAFILILGQPVFTNKSPLLLAIPAVVCVVTNKFSSPLQ
jgi:hypothetical protein